MPHWSSWVDRLPGVLVLLLALALLGVVAAPAGASAGAVPALAGSSARAAAQPCQQLPCVAGDDVADAILGSVILPRGAGGPGYLQLRRQATNCGGCAWVVRLYCPADASGGGCGAALSCPTAGELRYGVWMRQPLQTAFLLMGTFCTGGATQLRTPGQVSAALHDQFLELLPRLRPSVQPVLAVVNLPTVFSSGQVRTLTVNGLTLLDLNVSVSASAVWQWHFDAHNPAATLRTVKPGGRWPVRDVAWSFRKSGTKQVTVQATWAAQFTADGLGPFPVAGAPLTQLVTLALLVRPAKSVLVAAR